MPPKFVAHATPSSTTAAIAKPIGPDITVIAPATIATPLAMPGRINSSGPSAATRPMPARIQPCTLLSILANWSTRAISPSASGITLSSTMASAGARPSPSFWPSTSA